MFVRDVMTVGVFVVEVTDSLDSARAKLIEADVRHLPVLDRGRLVGIISERDLPRQPMATEEIDGPDQRALRIVDVMSSDVRFLEPECELSEAIDLMLEHRIGAVPVVAPGSERLVGIVSYVDVLRAARHVL